MYHNEDRATEAQRAAFRFLRAIGSKTSVLADTAIVLGTGWGGQLALEDEQSVPLERITGFENLGALELSGHARTLRYGFLNGKSLLVLDGRIHLNESPISPFQMVRLQIEMLFHLGVEKLILTCAAGSLRGDIVPGGIVIVRSFMKLYAPPMPLWGGEFCAPETALLRDYQNVAEQASEGLFPWCSGVYAMTRGPIFESPEDREILSEHADVVGMSMLPETTIAALYQVPVLGLCFVSNSAGHEHSHQENVQRANQQSAELGILLEGIVAVI